ncbi:hypothetical protein [Burkholderia sp. WAC0059]|uniref:hypothetical protein n=1 Tax=Burkholderia sp. WAC0059 TaxID=2066022 RepID=UPI0011AEDB8F|nr:hypothetical protein [Burkholderia sp. WAC0059]
MILLLREQAGDRAPGGQPESDGTPVLGGHGFWERLAERTGVLSRRWRKVYAREQKVTSDMLQALARLFPSYAFWLATGITDAVNGHVAPMTAQTFPERLYQGSAASEEYFRVSLALETQLAAEGHVNGEDDRERLYAVERTRPLAHWHESPLADAAYRMAGTSDYEQLQALWHQREAERIVRCRHIRGKDRPSVGRRESKGETGGSPVLGKDARSAHQDPWDLFYVQAIRKAGGGTGQ